ncbi:MAG: hypothetical protein ABJB16_06955 [Saprospiraceae bacterium]
MKTLFQLAKYNEANHKIIELLMPQEADSPLKKLFSIVFSERTISDKQAMMAIYGAKKLSTFSRLKTRLKDILIKVTLLQNSSLENEYSRANESMNQHRSAIAAKFLIQRRITSLAIEIAERALIRSIKYDATENIILLIRMLVPHYGTQEYNKDKFRKYLALQEQYLYVHSCEIKAQNYYLELQHSSLYSFAPSNESTIDKSKRYAADLDKIDNIKTYFFLTYKYRVKALNLEYEKDYEALLVLSDQTIRQLSTPKYKSNSFRQSLNLRKASALIQLGRNDEAILLGTKDMKSLPSGSLAWYFIAHYKLKAQLYKGDYKNAVDLIKLMIENPLFSKIGGNYRELFTATLGYIHLIVDSGLAGDPKKLKPSLPEFKLGKFLNTIPVFSKDKKGINASILLMHIAFLLQRKNYNAIIDRVDSLKQYAYQYLRKDDTFRSNCMIKMVIQMTKADFNPIRTERYTRDLLKQLEAVKLAGSGENIETEIIPYEVLWNIMKKALL